MKREIILIINKSEITAGTRGASLGPEAIMAVARKNGSNLFGQFPVEKINDVNYLLDFPIKYPKAKRIEGLVEIFTEISMRVSETLEKRKFPLVLASDHGSAGGTIAGIKKAFPDKKLGVIWIDAHGDLHTPYTTPSGNMHGMPVATALNEDNIACKINELPTEVLENWERLKSMGVPGAKLLPEHLVFIAVRDTEPEEDALFERLNLKNHSIEDIRNKGVVLVLEETLDQLNECDMIYVSFDVDSMDPEYTSHGTGTPVDNGLTPEEAHKILTTLAVHPKLVCMEFVEVNPCLDEKKNKMAEITFELLDAVTSSMIKNDGNGN